MRDSFKWMFFEIHWREFLLAVGIGRRRLGEAGFRRRQKIREFSFDSNEGFPSFSCVAFTGTRHVG